MFFVPHFSVVSHFSSNFKQHEIGSVSSVVHKNSAGFMPWYDSLRTMAKSPSQVLFFRMNMILYL